MGPGRDPDAWERGATRLIETVRQVDLTIPAVDAAIEAFVALETPAGATPVTAETWLRDFQERTMRRCAMLQLTRAANKMTEAARVCKKGILICVEPEMARSLKRLAVNEDTTLQALGLEAFDVLIAHRHGPK